MKTNQFPLIPATLLALMLSAAGFNTPAKETTAQTTAESAMTAEKKQAIEQEISGLVKNFSNRSRKWTSKPA